MNNDTEQNTGNTRAYIHRGTIKESRTGVQQDNETQVWTITRQGHGGIPNKTPAQGQREHRRKPGKGTREDTRGKGMGPGEDTRGNHKGELGEN